MPRKYLRITRRRTCDTLLAVERTKEHGGSVVSRRIIMSAPCNCRRILPRCGIF